MACFRQLDTLGKIPFLKAILKMPREYSLAVFARMVVAFTILWATIGVFLFSRLLHYLGWDTMNVEWQMMLFGALSLLGALIFALLFVLMLQLFQHRKAS